MAGDIYVVTFAAVSVSAAQDAFELVASSACRVLLREVVLQQYSDSGDAQAEQLGVTIVRGYTVAGTGGGAFTPLPINPVTGAKAAATTAAINNTTVANTGTAKVMRAGALNEQQGGFVYRPDKRDEMIILEKSERLVVRLTAPADAVTMNGTLVFEEIGRSGPIA